jgi:hypothetical protein
MATPGGRALPVVTVELEEAAGMEGTEETEGMEQTEARVARAEMEMERMGWDQ